MKSIRYIPASEIRADEVDGQRRITGRAVPFNELSHPIGGAFREVILEGSTTKTLEEFDQRALWSHDTSQVLGRRKNNTLRLEAREDGVHFELDLPNSPMGDNAFESIRRGDVEHMSFGFESVRDNRSDERSDDGFPIREIVEMRLMEISPVAFPAYESTAVQTREQREAEEFLSHNAEAIEVRDTDSEAPSGDDTPSTPVPSADHLDVDAAKMTLRRRKLALREIAHR